MKRIYLSLSLLLLPALVHAGWILQQSDDGHWVTGQNRNQQQLIISQNGPHKQFLLIITNRKKSQSVPTSASLSVDDKEVAVYTLKLLKSRPDSIALQLVLNQAEEDRLITHLVAGLKLAVQMEQADTINFSLDGFTNTFSDFLIAMDLGRLDPHWLEMQGYRKELTCYEIARAMVAAMSMRIEGKSRAETNIALSEQLSEEAAHALPDILDQTFSVNTKDLPRIPSTRKYVVFKRCMQRFN